MDNFFCTLFYAFELKWIKIVTKAVNQGILADFTTDWAAPE